MAHEQAFQQIADANGGTRASGTPGYEASVDYVVGQLTAAGYAVELPGVRVPLLRGDERAPADVAGLRRLRGYVLTFSPSGEVTAPATLIDVEIPPGPLPTSSTSGCEPEDFAGFPPGNIAVIQRGTCTFAVKAANAEDAQASAVVIFNEGQVGRTDVIDGTLGGPGVTIPVVGASFATGEELYALRNDGLVLHVNAVVIEETRTTWNVIAETAGGRDDNVVVVGAHLDSVVEGSRDQRQRQRLVDDPRGRPPDGEGQAPQHRPLHLVRGRGAGPPGLGRTTSSQLTPAEQRRHRPQPQLRHGRIAELRALRVRRRQLRLPRRTRIGGRAAGLGLHREGLRRLLRLRRAWRRSPPSSAAGRTTGPSSRSASPPADCSRGPRGSRRPSRPPSTAGRPAIAYDPCYHQACDTIANVNVTAIDQMSDATAFAVITFAQNTEGVNGEKGKGNFKPKKLDPSSDGPLAAA